MGRKRRVYLGADHGGFSLKRYLGEQLPKLLPDFEFVDRGTDSETSVDYPDFAALVSKEVVKGGDLGILVCGTGIGMSIAANKIKGVRAAEVWDVTSAKLAREHNNANVLCLGGRVLGPQVALDAATAWLKAEFQGQRHENRLRKIQALEEEE